MLDDDGAAVLLSLFHPADPPGRFSLGKGWVPTSELVVVAVLAIWQVMQELLPFSSVKLVYSNVGITRRFLGAGPAKPQAICMLSRGLPGTCLKKVGMYQPGQTCHRFCDAQQTSWSPSQMRRWQTFLPTFGWT